MAGDRWIDNQAENAPKGRPSPFRAVVLGFVLVFLLIGLLFIGVMSEAGQVQRLKGQIRDLRGRVSDLEQRRLF